MSKPYKKEKKTKRAKEDEKTNNRNRKYLMIAGGAIALVAIAVTAVLLFNPVVAMNGDNVTVYYTLMFENGTVIDTNMNGTPLALTVGGNQIIPGFSNAIVGMRLNQKKTVTIPYDQAYGPYRNDLIRTVNRTGAVANTTFTVGQYYTIHSKTDNTVSTIKILNVTPSTVTWDENSPLAGQNLTFTIQIVSVNKGNGINAAATALPTIPTTIPI
ncbi:MAG: FKBP-type peptidyl-prolyl cis-trans isomerase [Methanoregula sp.]|jgi:peptidylprolyl isomerase